eukprot:TRINITY_DN4373_c0_g1_i2.p1 TRINITY_DN4373_c0_g1~~TRINITY_DN4373_c0_g1_i2.p1  ORF type:complete len:881 (+),score=69.70 TRINITY_DN4373_c0_g1_i2:634-3276(+)
MSKKRCCPSRSTSLGSKFKENSRSIWHSRSPMINGQSNVVEPKPISTSCEFPFTLWHEVVSQQKIQLLTFFLRDYKASKSFGSGQQETDAMEVAQMEERTAPITTTDPTKSLDQYTKEDVQRWLMTLELPIDPKRLPYDGKTIADFTKEDLVGSFSLDGAAIFNAAAKLKASTSDRLRTYLDELVDWPGYDSWKREKWLDLPKSESIVRIIPFVGREAQISELKAILVGMEEWMNLHQAGRCSLESDHYKCSGYSYILAGAASGIGKSTFTRTAFVKLIEDQTFTREYPDLCVMVQRCIENRRLYRFNFLSQPLLDWERNEPQLSLCLRILHTYTVYHSKGYSESYTDFSIKHMKQWTSLILLDFLRTLFNSSDREMIILHIDEAQIIRNYGSYINSLLMAIYDANSHSGLACIVIFTGTDNLGMKQFIKTSGFNYAQIHLSPLTMLNMREIMISCLMEMYGENKTVVSSRDNYLHFILEKLVSLCGGNPQLLVFLIRAMGPIRTSELQTEEDLQSMSRKRLHSKEEVSAPNLCTTVSDLIDCRRRWDTYDRVVRGFVALVTSGHTLASVDSLQQSSGKNLRFYCLGHAVTETILERATEIVPGITVGIAESKGLIYVRELEVTVITGTKRRQHQLGCTIVFPPIYYHFPNFDLGESVDYTDSLGTMRFKILDFCKLYRLDAASTEELDIETLKFRIFWYRHTHPSNTFKLSQVFPQMAFPGYWGDREFVFPLNWNVHKLHHQVGKNEGWKSIYGAVPSCCFFWGCGNDPFFDSWACLKTPGVNSKNFFLVIQSKRRTTRGAFTTSDLKKQMEYLAKMGGDALAIIITDGPNQADMQIVEDKDVIIMSETSAEGTPCFDRFYGSVIGEIRRDFTQTEAEL